MAFPSIVFFGTPPFAVASLDAMIRAGFSVKGVVTAPDKPAGRGMKLQTSAVKQYAMQAGLPLSQPEKLKDPDFLRDLRAWQPDLQVVTAFRMLPEQVWSLPPMGTINVHASLLPRYRGAAPINWAIINGESETGLTTFRLQHAIDTGNLLLQRKLAIGPDETAGELHDRMMIAGGELLVETIRGLAAGTLREIPQNELIRPGERLPAAPKIFTETCRIRWELPLREVYNLVRGLSPYPAAFTEFRGKMLKLFRARPLREKPEHPPGTVKTDYKTYLRFAVPDGWLDVLELQWEGRRRMPVEDFLRGLHQA